VKPLASAIDAHGRRTPDGVAFVAGEERLTWRQYAERSDRLAEQLVALGLAPGERLAVLLPDGPCVHVAYVAAEKAGLTVVGIGPRAGAAELQHLLRVSGVSALLSRGDHHDLDLGALVAELRATSGASLHHLVANARVGEDALLVDAAPAPRVSRTAELEAELRGRPLGIDDVFLLNSTSGTTGMPKCVIHDQRRWLYFHQLAVEAGELSDEDVFLSAIPTPYGFGIWTSHVTPTLLGAPTVVMERFDADLLIDQIERHQVTVLAAVSTQFIMMLNALPSSRGDLGSLRILFTGGEAVPEDRAAEFEERTGATVLQFYGSNETGALSRTTTRDTRKARLTTAGRVIEGMNVRLFDDAGRDVTSTGAGQPGCRGPATSRGYYADDAANAELYTSDGWMLTGDLAEIDGDGYLRVIGRTGDFIIRGGKNVSGPAVEAAVCTHPAVALAAAVAMPDPVFGERVCVYAQLRDDTALSLEDLVAFLAAGGVSVETLPERLVIVEEIPRSSGGKVAKQALRDDIARRLAARDET
jgi:acyl-CoA synthetase